MTQNSSFLLKFTSFCRLFNFFFAQQLAVVQSTLKNNLNSTINFLSQTCLKVVNVDDYNFCSFFHKPSALGIHLDFLQAYLPIIYLKSSLDYSLFYAFIFEKFNDKTLRNVLVNLSLNHHETDWGTTPLKIIFSHLHFLKYFIENWS